MAFQPQVNGQQDSILDYNKHQLPRKWKWSHNKWESWSQSRLGGGINYCKTFVYNWTNSINSNWRSSYQYLKKWWTLLCTYVLKPYNDWRATKRNQCCKFRLG